MKRQFLLLIVFFLNSCVSSSFQSSAGCPAATGQRFSVLFEYGSAELNETAVRQLEEAALQAKKEGDYVCLLGRLSYEGVPADQALGAIDRAKNVAAIFLQEGVDVRKIYIGMEPQEEMIGLSEPLTSAEEKHSLEILIGK